MKINEKEFDSSTFGFKVGSIEFPWRADIDVKKLVTLAKLGGFRLVYVRRLTAERKNELEGLPGMKGYKFVWGGSMKENISPLVPMLPSQPFVAPPRGFCCERFPANAEKIPKELYDLMFLSGWKSRFKSTVDPNFLECQFRNLYTRWLHNAVTGQISDYFAVCYDVSQEDLTNKKEKLLVGFYSAGMFKVVRDSEGGVRSVTFGESSVGAIHPDYQGFGLGHVLYLHVCSHVLEVFGPDVYRRSYSVHPTHNGNDRVPRLMRRMNARTGQSWSYYHLWIELPTIPFNRPFLTGMEATLVSQQLTPEGIKSNGQCSKKCLHKLSKILQPAEPLLFLTSSATSALEMAAMCIGVSPGDEIILPSFTFVSTASAFTMFGAVPIFIDSRPDTLNMNEKLIESAITDKTKAICIVHYAGIACEMDEILDIARKYDLHVIEDAAHGLGGAYKGQRLGTIGDIGCFSFHYTKDIIAGEGGAIAINNESLRRKASVIFEKGTNRKAMIDGKVAKYQWVSQGSSFAPSEIVAATLLAQLECWDEILSSRLKIWRVYHDFFGAAHRESKFAHCSMMPKYVEPSGHIFWLRFQGKKGTSLKHHFLKKLEKSGVETATHYVPLHRTIGGQKYGRPATSEFLVCQNLGTDLLRLPLWCGLLDLDVQKVLGAFQEAESEFLGRSRL